MRSLLNVPWSRNFARFGSLTFLHEPVSEIRIHTVESQNHRSLKRRLSIRIAPPQKAEQLTNRPSHQRVERIEERNKDCPERREHRKSRTRPGVSMGKGWQENERDQQDPCGAGALAREKLPLATERRAITQRPTSRSTQAGEGARPTQSLHILIPNNSLKTNPATIDKMKNSQIQLMPYPATSILRSG